MTLEELTTSMTSSYSTPSSALKNPRAAAQSAPFATCSLALRNFPRFPIDRDGSKSIILGEWLDHPDHWVWTSKDTEYGVAPCAKSGLGLDPDRHSSLGPCSLRRYSVLWRLPPSLTSVFDLGLDSRWWIATGSNVDRSPEVPSSADVRTST